MKPDGQFLLSSVDAIGIMMNELLSKDKPTAADNIIIDTFVGKFTRRTAELLGGRIYDHLETADRETALANAISNAGRKAGPKAAAKAPAVKVKVEPLNTPKRTPKPAAPAKRGPPTPEAEDLMEVSKPAKKVAKVVPKKKAVVRKASSVKGKAAVSDAEEEESNVDDYDPIPAPIDVISDGEQPDDADVDAAEDDVDDEEADEVVDPVPAARSGGRAGFGFGTSRRSGGQASSN